MMTADGMELGVLLIPGESFSTTEGLKNYMRASFSMIEPEQLEEGMIRFARMIERERKRIASERNPSIDVQQSIQH